MASLEDIRNLVKSNAEYKGWILNNDEEWVENLIIGLFENRKRYGYPSCPCRLAYGEYALDKDIICPCDYAELDIRDFGHCYCALFFDKDFFKKGKVKKMIPERRPPRNI
ncbi:MAG: ferredoxin-thioredoxin reductase catalytic domain-containing protein [Candidatus Helarchaeota archaeon]